MSSEVGVGINVRVKPGAKRSQLVGRDGSCYRISIAAPPVEGKANMELVAFMGKLLGVPRSRVSIVRGNASRSKVVFVQGLSAHDVEERLTGHASGGVQMRMKDP